ncbi:MAG: PA4642 family protein [Pseudomonadales bacterium]|jgi:hypothetical protein|nr:PA4642 family protein [Pseudomonadales bacterium]MDP6473082.1 PA4642 family protein [Pseudomonadales bacterium]MDP6826161.1 PA4642 family protein [Pseudomonadales bacterium]MDP6971949.1 PA4642 family protein [Pseudomonadales bacterium]|tara:strand:+ start:624 stop:917 length:294 start_codon:yes stop_codon:yes gene_type:complete
MRPDKKIVIDEEWGENCILRFLDKQPMGDDVNVDFSALLHAYRSMREADFARFIEAFTTAGRDLSAPGPEGVSLLQFIAEHERSAQFRKILRDAGAS